MRADFSAASGSTGLHQRQKLWPRCRDCVGSLSSTAWALALGRACSAAKGCDLVAYDSTTAAHGASAPEPVTSARLLATIWCRANCATCWHGEAIGHRDRSELSVCTEVRRM